MSGFEPGIPWPIQLPHMQHSPDCRFHLSRSFHVRPSAAREQKREYLCSAPLKEWEKGSTTWAKIAASSLTSIKSLLCHACCDYLAAKSYLSSSSPSMVVIPIGKSSISHSLSKSSYGWWIQSSGHSHRASEWSWTRPSHLQGWMAERQALVAKPC